jgi:uncharacterized membrane protein
MTPSCWHAAGLSLLALALCVSGCAEPEDDAPSPDSTAAAPAVPSSTSVWAEAQQRGVRFRAVGQEPGWLLEITDDSLHFAWAYGQEAITVPRQHADTTRGRAVHRADTPEGPLRIEAEATRCTDTMSGEQFSHTVTVTLDSTSYAGCGRRLP